MIYQKEIDGALNWLFETQNKENFGWSWVRDISPNEQNTAEVVYAVSLFCDRLSHNQKELINESVKKWLLMPQKHAVLTIDWAWVGLALSKYLEKYDEYSPDIERHYIGKSIETCVKAILDLQNDDGGWGDYKNDMSTAFRTSISIIFLENQSQIKDIVTKEKVKLATNFLLELQNDDGGFGNIRTLDISKNYSALYAGIEQELVENQFTSSISATGYSLWALACNNRYRHLKEIEKASLYLKEKGKSGYEIFLEVGVRRGTIFTFRHFGAVWMGIGLLLSGKSNVTSDETIKLIKYLLSLYDPINRGFRCNDSSEVYTWSDCNVLMFFRIVIDLINDMKGIDYTDIIMDYLLNQ